MIFCKAIWLKLMGKFGIWYVFLLLKEKLSAEIGCVISLIAQRIFLPFPSHLAHLIFWFCPRLLVKSQKYLSLLTNQHAQIFTYLCKKKNKITLINCFLFGSIFFFCRWKQSSECKWSHLVRGCKREFLRLCRKDYLHSILLP